MLVLLSVTFFLDPEVGALMLFVDFEEINTADADDAMETPLLGKQRSVVCVAYDAGLENFSVQLPHLISFRVMRLTPLMGYAEYISDTDFTQLLAFILSVIITFL